MKNNNDSTHTPETGKDDGVIKERGKDGDTNLPVKVRFQPPSKLSPLVEKPNKGHFVSSDAERQSSGDVTGHPTLSNEINILAATFNIGNAPLDPAEISHWLPLSDSVTPAASDIPTPNCAGPDIVVVGLQESFYRKVPHPILPNANVKQQSVPEANIPSPVSSPVNTDSVVDDSFHVVSCSGEDNEDESEAPPSINDSRRLGAAMELAAAGLEDAIDAISTGIRKPKSIIKTSLQTGSDLITGKITKQTHLKDTIRDHLGDNYTVVVSCRRLQMRLRVYVRKDRMPDIALDNIEVGAENTGIAGVAPNKGGLAVKFSIRGSSLAFISCHLQAHKGAVNCSRRTDSVANILTGIRMGSGNLKRIDIDAQAHHTFLMGDLNFRVEPKDLELPKDHSFEQHREHVLMLVKEGRLPDIHKGDELAKELKDEKLLVGFNTVEPSFPPTFKMIRGTIDEYDSKRSKCLLLSLL